MVNNPITNVIAIVEMQGGETFKVKYFVKNST
jgi:hypothetical protein